MGKFVIQVLAGVLGALFGWIIGFLGMDYACQIGWPSRCGDLWGLGLFSYVAMIVPICVAVGATAGVTIAGRLAKKKAKASPWLSLLGAIVGAIVSMLLDFILAPQVLYWVQLLRFVALPISCSIGAAIGYNLPNWISSRSQPSDGEERKAL